MPTKHCLWGSCSSDSRFPQFCEGVRFVPFAKPTRTPETFLRYNKACGRPHSLSTVSKIISFFITRSGQNFTHERSFCASEMTITKRCDVCPVAFLFVVVAGHVCVCARARARARVCVCVREPVLCFCFEDGITNVYVSTV